MNRTISSNTLLRAIQSKPSLIKSVKSIPERVLVEILNLKRSYKIIDFMTPKQKQELLTERVLEAFLKEIPEDRNFQHINFLHIIFCFPEAVRDKIGHNIKRIDLVKGFPSAPRTVWLEYIRKNECSYKDIPENYRDREMRLTWLIINNTIESSAISDDLVDDLLRSRPNLIGNLFHLSQFFSHIKPLTKTQLAIALNATSEPLNLDIKFSKNPHLWDIELAERAISNHELLGTIPPEILTRDLCLRAVKNDGNNLRWVPEKFLDMDMVCEGLGESSGRLGIETDLDLSDLIPNSCMNKKFLLKIAAADQAAQADNTLQRLKYYLHRAELGKTDNRIEYQSNYFSRKWWPEVIKICPKAFKLIPKSDQTNEIIKAYITTASIKQIDADVNHINLSKIKKPEYMAFLIGTSSPLLQSIMSQILIPKEGIVSTFDDEVCVIDLSNTEFRNIQSYL